MAHLLDVGDIREQCQKSRLPPPPAQPHSGPSCKIVNCDADTRTADYP